MKNLTKKQKQEIAQVMEIFVTQETKMLKELQNPNSEGYKVVGIVEMTRMKKAQKENLKDLLNDFKKFVNTEQDYKTLNYGLKAVGEMQVEKTKENSYKITAGEVYDILTTLKKFTGTIKGSYKLFKETTKGQRQLDETFALHMLRQN